MIGMKQSLARSAAVSVSTAVLAGAGSLLAAKAFQFSGGQTAFFSAVCTICLAAAAFFGSLCFFFLHEVRIFWKIRGFAPIRFSAVSRDGRFLTQSVEDGLPFRHELKYVNEMPPPIYEALRGHIEDTFRTKQETSLEYHAMGRVRRAIFKYLPENEYGREAVFWASWDITELDAARKNLEAWSRNETLINRCLQTLVLSNSIDRFTCELLAACESVIGERCALFRLDESGTDYTAVFDRPAANQPIRKIAADHDAGAGCPTLAAWHDVFSRGEAVVIDDVEHIQDEYAGIQQALSSQGMRSVAAVGICHNGKLHDCLVVSYRSKQHAFSSAETGLLHDIARLYSLALQRSDQDAALVREREAKDELAKNEQLLNQCLETLMRRGSLESAMQRTLDILSIHFRPDYMFVMHYDMDNHEGRIICDRPLTASSPRIPSSLPLSSGEPDAKWLRRETFAIADTDEPGVKDALGFWKEPVERVGMKSLYVFRLSVLGRSYGTLTMVYSTRKKALSQDELRLLQSVAGFMEVVLERSAVNAQVRNSRDEALAAARDKSTFLATMSHEIRTPLNAVIGFSELLQNDDIPPEERKEYLKSVSYSGNSLLSLINDVLDLSKIEAERMQIVPVRTDFREMIRELAAVFRQRAAENDIALLTDCPESIPLLMVDPQRVRQILYNLVSNAVKFSAHGKIFVTVTFVPDAEGERGTLTAEVRDTGCGIPESQQDRIFQPFMQVVGAPVQAGLARGTGLGLPISRKLAERMGGSLTLKSKPGEGSRFTLALPRVPFMQRRSEETESVQASGGYRTDVKILLVDDVELNLRMLKKMLELLGLQADTAALPGIALDRASRVPYDLVMTDVWMPGQNGMQLAAELRKQAGGRRIKVFAVTADVDFIKSRDADNFDGCLLKPITKDSLREMLCRAVPAGPSPGQ